jgi:uncharacterized membrane protein
VTEQTRTLLDQVEYDLLSQETAHWVEWGIISKEQAQAILAGYTTRPGGFSQGRLITTLAVLGSVLVGLGVILFIASNWQEIGKWTKLALLFVGLAITYGGGYVTRERYGMVRVGTALIFLGVLLYGAAIFLIGQLYHIPAGRPSLYLWWFLGAAPMAYAVRSRAVLFLAAVTGVVTLGMYSYSWVRDTPAGGTSFAAMGLVTGVAITGLGLAHRAWSPIKWGALVLQWVGTVVFFIPFFAFTFSGIFEDAVGETRAHSWEFHVAYFGSLAVGVGSIGYAWLGEQVTARRLAATFTYASAGLLVMLASSFLGLYTPIWGALFYALLFNALLAIAILGLIVLGYRERGMAFVNLGLAVFTVDVFGRYVDFGWGLLDRSIFFIVAGVLLLAGGFVLERLRRRMMAGMTAEGAGDDG